MPLIHALAGDGQISLLTKQSTAADLLLKDDPATKKIVWLDRNPPGRQGRHDGPLGFARLVADIRDLKAGASVLLHQSTSLAAALAAARIPRRYGYGYGAQRLLLNAGPFLPNDIEPRHPTEQAAAYAKALGLGPLRDDAQIVPSPALASSVLAREGPLDRWAVLGVGSTEPNRCWPPDRFADLAKILIARGYAGVFLLAAKAEAGLAHAVHLRAGDSPKIRRAVGWPLGEVIALLQLAGLFVGNDSGMLNLRAAVGGVAFGLFGVSGPLTHSTRLLPVVSDAGPRAGMDSITLDDALSALESHGVL